VMSDANTLEVRGITMLVLKPFKQISHARSIMFSDGFRNGKV
jgi:hypothetical protein